MSQEHKDRIVQAMRETNSLIAKELKYRKDLQKVEYLNSLYSHKQKLEGML